MDKSQIKAFLEQAPLAVAMFDREMRTISASRRWIEDYKLAGPVEGLSYSEICPDAPEKFGDIPRRALAGETLEAEGRRFERPGASVQWLRWRIAPWRGPDGEIAGVIIFSQDVTALKEADEGARRNRLRLELALDAAAMISFDWDVRRDEVERFSAGDETPRREDDVVASSLGKVLAAVHEDDKSKFLAALRRAFACEMGRYECEIRVLRPYGAVSWFLERGRLERDENGAPARLVGVAQDITERKIAEQALAEGNRRREEFLAILAHELRNPLAPIRNAIHLLSQRKNDLSALEEAGALIEILERQTEHLIRLVDDLLEVSRITAGKIELRKARVDLADVVRQAIETAAPTIKAQRHDLTVSLEEAPLLVDGDCVRLVQALANLLINAAKYTPPQGRIEIAARRRGDEGEIGVRDNGIGVAPEILSRLFALFAQSPEAKTRAQGGVGVGLTLARRLVEMHGGRVEGRSEGPGRGAEFVMYLPLVASSPTPTPERRRSSEQQIGAV